MFTWEELLKYGFSQDHVEEITAKLSEWEYTPRKVLGIGNNNVTLLTSFTRGGMDQQRAMRLPLPAEVVRDTSSVTTLLNHLSGKTSKRQVGVQTRLKHTNLATILESLTINYPQEGEITVSVEEYLPFSFC